MIDAHLYLAFVVAVSLLMLIPGPNVALIVAHSLGQGMGYGLLTVAGTASAMVLQLGVVALGLTGLLEGLASLFETLRWVGVAYLLYLGLRQWRAASTDLAPTPAAPRSVARLFGRAMLVSLTNPKTLFFYGAFFPQFIDASRPALPQISLLAATFLGLALLIDSGWALLAGHARPVLRGRGQLRNRLSGGLLMGAGAALALAQRR